MPSDSAPFDSISSSLSQSLTSLTSVSSLELEENIPQESISAKYADNIGNTDNNNNENSDDDPPLHSVFEIPESGKIQELDSYSSVGSAELGSAQLTPSQTNLRKKTRKRESLIL